MTDSLVEIIFSGVLYVVITFSLFKVFRRWGKRRSSRPNNTDNDGGLLMEESPIDLDLPPGICLPGQGPTYKKETDLVP